MIDYFTLKRYHKHNLAKKDEKMKLIVPTIEIERQIEAFRQELIDIDGDKFGLLSLKRADSIRAWLNRVEAMSKVETCPEKALLQKHYLYVREEDNRVFGLIQIRYDLNAFLKKYAGHLGFSVRPLERCKGHGSKMLAASFPICKALGIEKALLVCYADNEASRRTIVKSGGIFEERLPNPYDEGEVERYRIDL